MLLKNGKVLIKDKIEQVDIKIEKEKKSLKFYRFKRSLRGSWRNRRSYSF